MQKDKGLVSAKDLATAINMNKMGALGTLGGWVLMKMLKLDKLNAIYNRNKQLEGVDFLNALLDEFEIKFEIPEEDFKNIPKEGAFITISNHPLGGIDGILLLKLLAEKRPDFKIIANFLLQRIKPLSPYVLPVNPFEDRKDVKNSVMGFKQAIMHLREGKPLGIFPAGEVSVIKNKDIVVDKPWEEAAMKLAQKAKVPIIPIYFHAKNSKLFYFLANLSGTLRTAKLPSELLTQKQRTINVRIGKPITVAMQEEYKQLDAFTDFLRKKTYILANAFQQDKKLLPLPKVLKVNKSATTPKQIEAPIAPTLIEQEIDYITKKDYRLLKNNNYEVFLAPYAEIPNIPITIIFFCGITMLNAW